MEDTEAGGRATKLKGEPRSGRLEDPERAIWRYVYLCDGYCLRSRKELVVGVREKW